MIAAIIILVIIVAAVLGVALVFNGLVSARNQVDNGWAQVDVADDRLRFAALRLAGGGEAGGSLVGTGFHRGAVEELVVARHPAAGGDRLGPALG